MAMTELEQHYNKFNEEKRLDSRHGRVEFITSMKYIHNCLDDIKAAMDIASDIKILDIGAGTGSVTVELALHALYGTVYAVERTEEGCSLIAKNAEKFGFFSKYLPEETVSIIQEMPTDPLDVLWDQIQIAYAAIIRAQQIMYVRDRDDKTIEKIEEKDGNVIGERWEVQQAWDKQGKCLQAQARAQSELRSLIKQYDELLHKRWDLASDEQKARIAQIKAQTDKLKGTDNEEELSRLDQVLSEIKGVV